MRAASMVIKIFSMLGLLGWGGVVVVAVASKGWFDGLAVPVVVAGIFFVYFVIGLMTGKKKRPLAGVLGMLLTVPLMSVVAAQDDWEMRGLILGAAPALLLGLASLVLLITSRKGTTSESA